MTVFAGGGAMAGYWRELYEKMQEDLQSPAFRQFGSYSITGRSFSYRSLDAFRSLSDWVKREADKEDGRALSGAARGSERRTGMMSPVGKAARRPPLSCIDRQARQARSGYSGAASPRGIDNWMPPTRISTSYWTRQLRTWHAPLCNMLHGFQLLHSRLFCLGRLYLDGADTA